jgi:glycosyltransferase involved in cell wall biosynthesis
VKICLISTDFPPTLGGVASHAYELSQALSKLGHQVYVISSRMPNTPEQEMMGLVEVYRPNMPWQRPFYNIWLKSFLKKFLAQHQIDIVHVHGMRPLESTRGLSVPVVFTNHTSGFLKRLTKPRFWSNRLAGRLKHIRLVLAPSVELCEATQQVGYTGAVKFISNGVDTQKFRPDHLRNESAIPVILLARRLVEKNGVLVFAQALALISHVPFTVRIAGVGLQQADMKHIFQQANLTDRVTFLGGIPNHEMPSVYHSADISVLPSFYEATSITGLESMACGLPLVGTAVGGIPYLIEQGVSGELVPSHNPQALADALAKVIADVNLRQRYAQAARKKAEDQFDWHVIAQQTVDAYQLVWG